MLIRFLSLLSCCSVLLSLSGCAQDGTILSRTTVHWQEDDYLVSQFSQDSVLLEDYAWMDRIRVERITYESDGLEVVGYLAQPLDSTHVPCVIYNRGGNREFGKLNTIKAFLVLGKLAAQGYVVAGSQYRGNDGGEGQEEFGGADVNDVLNLVPSFAEVAKADTSRMGLFGWSRGGMMTYLALMQNHAFDAAVVGGAASDLHMVKNSRNDKFETVYQENIPGYDADPQAALDARSAIRRVADLPKTTPILMLHGTADWRVVPQMALELSAAFIEHQVPHRLILYEGGDHGLREFRDEVDAEVVSWLNRYVKNGEPLPNLSPHGN